MRYIRYELPNAASYAILAEFGEAGFDVDAIFTWAQHDDPIFRRNRWQFIATLPVLCPLLTKPDKNLHELELETLIDCGQPLIDGFARLLGIPQFLLRRVIGIQPAQLGRDWITRPHALFSMLAHLSISKPPKTTANWRLLWQLHEALGFADYPTFLDQAQRDSISPECQMRRHLLNGLYLKGSCPPNLSNALYCFERYFNALGHTNSASDKKETTETITCLVARLQRQSPRRLLSNAARWWQELHQQSGQSQLDTQPNWPALPSLPWRNGTLQVIALCSQSALDEEGERLGHCVATYETFCLLGNSHIVSIRDLAGNSMSTAEFVLTEDATGRIRALCVNHAGTENEPPPQACQCMLEALARNWVHPRFQSRFAELFTRQKTQNASLLKSLDARSSTSAATQR
ncbi:MAG: PcfJ domain-containing protein [Azonexus sp.]|nr:PcfJ domain-containing protein [Azonexus sp.]